MTLTNRRCRQLLWGCHFLRGRKTVWRGAETSEGSSLSWSQDSPAGEASASRVPASETTGITANVADEGVEGSNMSGCFWSMHATRSGRPNNSTGGAKD